MFNFVWLKLPYRIQVRHRLHVRRASCTETVDDPRYEAGPHGREIKRNHSLLASVISITNILLDITHTANITNDVGLAGF